MRNFGNDGEDDADQQFTQRARNAEGGDVEGTRHHLELGGVALLDPFVEGLHRFDGFFAAVHSATEGNLDHHEDEVMPQEAVKPGLFFLQGHDVHEVKDPLAVIHDVVIAGQKGLFAHRLSRTPHQVLIELDVEITDRLGLAEAGVDEMVIFVEAMLGKNDARRFDHIEAEHRRMDGEILARIEGFDVVEADRLIRLEPTAIGDGIRFVLPPLPIGVIGEVAIRELFRGLDVFQ